MKQFLFIDDSRMDELGVSSLGGLLVSEEEYSRLQQALRDIKCNLLDDSLAPVKWSPPGESDSLFSRQRRHDSNQLREQVCDLLGTISGFLIFALIDEQQRRLNRQLRLQYLKQALEFLCQRVEMHCSGLREHHEITVVAEIPGSGHEGGFSRHFYHIITNGCVYPQFNLALTHFNRTMFLSHDYLCEGLQLADIATGAACFAAKGRGQQFLDRFKTKIRRGPRGVKGYGIVVYPSNSFVADSLCGMCADTDSHP